MGVTAKFKSMGAKEEASDAEEEASDAKDASDAVSSDTGQKSDPHAL